MAGVNLYDKPSQAQFMNTYSPIPFNILGQAAAMRQGKIDEGLGRLDAAQMAVDSISYIPNSKDQLKVEEWRRNLADIAGEFVSQDVGDPEISRKMHGAMRQAVNPNEVKAVQESRAGYDAYMKSTAQMKSKGQQVYNPYNFAGYDTLEGSQGIFGDLPMMDLGAKAEQSINKFMLKPQKDWRETQLDSGRIGIEEYRDINKINQLIESAEFGQLTNDPSIQQLMEREGLDETGFKQYLQNLAPSYEHARLTSAEFPPG